FTEVFLSWYRTPEIEIFQSGINIYFQIIPSPNLTPCADQAFFVEHKLSIFPGDIFVDIHIFNPQLFTLHDGLLTRMKYLAILSIHRNHYLSFHKCNRRFTLLRIGIDVKMGP